MALVTSIAVVATACASSDTNDAITQMTTIASTAATTTPAPISALTVGPAPAQEPSEPSVARGLDAPSASCRALLVELLQIIEPYVAERDVDDLMSGNLDSDGMAAATADTEERLETECPAIDNQEAFEMMIEIASSEAPGTVWYLDTINQAAQAQP